MLPIFPLGIVLFPESVIQLHIFEPKYKNMVNDCIASNSDFGINLILSSKIKKIGCTARIVEILKKYPDGKLDILVRGIKKYILKDSKLSDRQYLLGNVEYLDENFDYPEPNLLDECVQLYNSIAEEIKSLHLDKVNVSMFYSLTPSYFFAQKAGLSREQKYHLLKLENENLRLKYLLEHLKEVEPMLREVETIQKLIKNDGYEKIL